MTRRRLAIIGGGPVGIEAAVLASQRGFDVTVFERGVVGAHLTQWSHVQFFSPWSMNRSPWGAALLAEQQNLAAGDEFPTAGDYLRDYLQPLIDAAGLRSGIRDHCAVVGVARRDAWKGQLIGHRVEAGPFLLSVAGPGGHELVEADVVFDASGVYGQPNFLGLSGLRAAGEQSIEDLIEHWIPDPRARDRGTYAGKHTMVVGDGYSASTSVGLLLDLREKEPGTQITWVLSPKDPPYVELEDDPLPARLALARFSNSAARGGVEGIAPLQARIQAFERDGGRVTVKFVDAPSVTVDRIVANVGYRPDLEMTRELQVHVCWASEGPMKLAATLLAQSGNADCLTQVSAGVDSLRSPEPNFFVIGNKSYGRNSNFLLRIGFEQIEAIVETLTP